MDWSDYLNPFTALGNAAASVVVDGWTAAMLGIWNAGLWLLKLALTVEDAVRDLVRSRTSYIEIVPWPVAEARARPSVPSR